MAARAGSTRAERRARPITARPPRQTTTTDRTRRSRCPVSCTLDALGDRWSLLIVRDLILGKTRYAEFVRSPEGIPTNILADRLKRLVAAGVIKASRYCVRPPRLEYRLTRKGEDLRPIVRAMADWGVRHGGGRLPKAIVASLPRPARALDDDQVRAASEATPTTPRRANL